MLPDIENLLKLQDTDKEIRRLQDEVAELPKRVTVIEQKLAGTRAQLEKAQTAVKADETSRRKYETNISDLRGKISKYRDQSLDVKTNDQYKALMHEIEFSQTEIRTNEDRILDLMVNAESREKEVKAAEIEKEKVEARERTAEDEKQLTEWNAKRDTWRAGIDPDVLRHYERVFKFRGSGISEVRDQKCSACQVMIRPQTFNEVRAGDKLIFCESCQRILYYDASKETPVEKPVTNSRKHRARPKVDSAQAWFYHPNYDQVGEAYLAFLNSSGSSTRRVYDFHTGRQVGDTLMREGNYRLAFPEDLNEVVRLNGSWDEEEIDSWGEELPMVVLDGLQSDLSAARSESGQRATAPAETVSPEQAAS